MLQQQRQQLQQQQLLLQQQLLQPQLGASMPVPSPLVAAAAAAAANPVVYELTITLPAGVVPGQQIITDAPQCGRVQFTVPAGASPGALSKRGAPGAALATPRATRAAHLACVARPTH